MKKLLRLSAGVLALCFLILLTACSGKDTDGQKPVEARPLTWAVGTPLPTAEDFFGELPEGATVSFAGKMPFDGLHLGENSVELVYHPKKGRSGTFSVTLTLVKDETPPVISGAHDLMAYIGEGISYRSGVTVSDNCDGSIELTVDSSAVNLMTEGTYPAVYYATDHAGNVASVTVMVHVYLEKITPEILNEEIDRWIEALGLRSMTKEQQVRAIYQFVHTSAEIKYIDQSDKTDWVREAYFCLQNRRGDCFSYFSLSKAFFERLGIENLDVQRSPGYTTDTHYWSMVNIAATGEPARWYHYDATRVRDVPYSGALLTDRQVDRFSELRNHFYWFDRTGYPATATEEITERPDLK